ncbi:carbohydrate-binding protein [Kineosporia babensis]|uniref:CBM6 domain-containing protein n=1 Tax=Kineosporia babensis TaxID=499548 RepID=A0A9X1NA08_9ACTN|nr:hypothetical protein [Kineosporia babensis]MCD5310295.1 hypothetical protein [Kineosporia babensis]
MSETTRKTLTSSPGSALWSGRSPVVRCVILGVTVALSGLAVPVASAALAPQPNGPSSSGLPDSPSWALQSEAGQTTPGSVPSPSATPTPSQTQAAATPTATAPAKEPKANKSSEAAQPDEESPKAPATKTSESEPEDAPTAEKKTESKEKAAVFTARRINAGSPQNERVGDIREQQCSSCASGSRISYLEPGRSLTVPVNGVEVGGARTLTVVYENDGLRDLYVTVNGNSQKFSVSGAGDWVTPAYLEIPIKLKKGSNTIRFDNPHGPGPDLDQFRIE